MTWSPLDRPFVSRLVYETLSKCNALATGGKAAKVKDKTSDPTSGIMDMMKNLYDDGDDNMRKIIGESMMKSQRGDKSKIDSLDNEKDDYDREKPRKPTQFDKFDKFDDDDNDIADDDFANDDMPPMPDMRETMKKFGEFTDDI